MNILYAQLQILSISVQLLKALVSLQAPIVEAQVVPIQDYIYEKATEEKVDPELAVNIVRCESSFDRYAKNPSSTASGYFQFLDGTWDTTMQRMGLPTSTLKTSMPEAIDAGVFLLRNDGTRHWTESSGCWSKFTL